MDNEEKNITTEQPAAAEQNAAAEPSPLSGTYELEKKQLVQDQVSRKAQKEELRREKNSLKVERLLEKKRRREHKALHEAPSFQDVPDADVSYAVEDEGQEPGDPRSEAERDERLREKNSKKLAKQLQQNRRREESADREVLTYEDLPLNEREEKPRSFKGKVRKKRIILTASILLILVFAVYIFTNTDKLSLHNITNFIRYGIFNSDSEQRFPVAIRGESITPGNFLRMGQDLCYASGTRVQSLNNYGKRMLTAQHGYNKPVLVACDEYSLVYGLGGTGFQINNLKEHLYTGTAEHNILVADIVNNGTYAIVTQSDGYLSKLTVYDNRNNKIFAYSFADYYITSVSLKSNGRMAVLSGLSAHNGTEISSLYVLDFTKESPAQFVELEDTVIYEVAYLTNTYAAAIGSSGIYVLNTDSGSVKSTDYEGRTLTAYTINRDTDTFSISLSRSGDGRNCDILSFGSSGSLSASFSTDLRVISISTYKNRVALLTTDMIYLYSKNGSSVSTADAGIDPRCVVLYTSSDAYVLDTSEIRTVSM